MYMRRLNIILVTGSMWDTLYYRKGMRHYDKRGRLVVQSMTMLGFGTYVHTPKDNSTYESKQEYVR